MTDAALDTFRTRVRGVCGTWPQVPEFWSYSSLKDAEDCPRRWALARAKYPEIWNRAGYPPTAALPAAVGDVIHRSLDAILQLLHSEGCASIHDPTAVAALRRVGGFSSLI